MAGITFDVPYQITNLPSAVNPSYQPSVQFAFEQPLLQGFGVEINQLRQSSPTSELLQNAGVLAGLPQPGVEGILITRIRFDQQRAEFQRNVNIMLANVEFAYWNLYNAYWTLYANEAALRQAYEAWKIAVVKLQAGKIAVADVAQARGQYELFRFNRLQALGAVSGSVIEAERELRGMLGLPADDGTRLVPSDCADPGRVPPRLGHRPGRGHEQRPGPHHGPRTDQGRSAERAPGRERPDARPPRRGHLRRQQHRQPDRRRPASRTMPSPTWPATTSTTGRCRCG